MNEDLKLTTWGVKVTDEVREKIKNAMEASGLQGKDFIESMVCLYEANLTKASQPILAQEIAELETITRRIISMYLGLGDRVKTILDEKDRVQQEQQEQNRETTKLLSCKIQELEEKITNLSEANLQLHQEKEESQQEKVNLENGYLTKVNQLTKLTMSNEALIEEYKQKNDNLTGLIGDYKQDRDKLQAVTFAAAAKDKEIQQLQDKVKAAAANAEKQALEHEKQLLQKDRDYQAQLQTLREEYNNQVKELLKQMQQPEKNTSKQNG